MISEENSVVFDSEAISIFLKHIFLGQFLFERPSLSLKESFCSSIWNS